MPISSYAIIPDVIRELEKKQPETVLDLGIGNGMYGALIRNYFPNVHITGVEAWEDYENHLWNVYNEVYVQDIASYLTEDGLYDVVIMTDVIEHFTKEDGYDVIEAMKSKLKRGGLLLISTPAIFVEQGAVGGNEFERHRSLWTPEDLPEFDQLRTEIPDKYSAYMFLYKFTKK